jgi:hypothetical protein
MRKLSDAMYVATTSMHACASVRTVVKKMPVTAVCSMLQRVAKTKKIAIGVVNR